MLNIDILDDLIKLTYLLNKLVKELEQKDYININYYNQTTTYPLIPVELQEGIIYYNNYKGEIRRINYFN